MKFMNSIVGWELIYLYVATLFTFQCQIEKFQQEFLFLGLSSMSAKANEISSIKTKRNPKLKKQKAGTIARNDFFLINLALDVKLKIPISTHHCILLIDLISYGNPNE